jgi:hypothetical protein
MLLFRRIACITIIFFIADVVSGNKIFAIPGTPNNILKKSLPQININILSGPSIINDSPNCIIPFTRAGNLILVKGKADTTEGNFILDTGAPYLVLNLTYFRNYGTVVSNEEQAGITGIGPLVAKTVVNKFSLGTFHYTRVNADVTNLGNIENSKGVKILGLLGVALFKQFEMVIDYEQRVIYLHRIDKKEAASYQSEMLQDTSTYSIVDIETADNRIVTRTTMAGKKLRLMIDCGAESNLLDSRLPNKIFENVSITGRVILLGSSNEKIEALAGDMKNMQIGNSNISSLPVLITNLDKTCISAESCIDGILGFDFLSLHKIGFNFVKRKMYIWK